MLLTAWETDGQRELNRRRIARMLVFHRTALLGNLTLTLTSTSKSSTPQQYTFCTSFEAACHWWRPPSTSLRSRRIG